MSDTNIDRKKVAVLSGGVGSEREVSLNSGRTVYAALREAGMEVVLSDITPEDMRILDDASIDVFFWCCTGSSARTASCSRFWSGGGLSLPDRGRGQPKRL